MKKKYLTIRAELVEAGKRDCIRCMFGTYVDIYCICGIENHPKYDEKHCETGYWKEIDLNK